MDTKARPDCGNGPRVRGSSPSSALTDEDLKAASIPIPVPMSPTLAGVGGSTVASEDTGSLSSASPAPSSAGDDCSEYSEAPSYSTLSSRLAGTEPYLNPFFELHPLVSSSLPIQTQQLGRSAVDFDYPLLRHHRQPARGGTWPLVASATVHDLPRNEYLLFENATVVMAHSKHTPNPGYDHSRSNTLPVRQVAWAHPSPLSRKSSHANQDSSMFGTHNRPQEGLRQLKKQRPGTICVPVLTDGTTLDSAQDGLISSTIPNLENIEDGETRLVHKSPYT